MAYVFCNRCGHRNPPGSAFCSACGTVLDLVEERTVVLTRQDPLQDAPGIDDDVVVNLDRIPGGQAILVVRDGPNAGENFSLADGETSIGRHPESDVVLDDITVSRRHVAITHDRGDYLLTDLGSLNGTYLNNERVDSGLLRHGDEVQVGRYRMVFFERPEDLR